MLRNLREHRLLFFLPRRSTKAEFSFCRSGDDVNLLGTASSLLRTRKWFVAHVLRMLEATAKRHSVLPAETNFDSHKYIVRLSMPDYVDFLI